MVKRWNKRRFSFARPKITTRRTSSLNSDLRLRLRLRLGSLIYFYKPSTVLYQTAKGVAKFLSLVAKRSYLEQHKKQD